MRLERLSIRGLGPFRSEVELDLATLDARLVAIVGPNGAGKCLPGSSRIYVDGAVSIPIRTAVARRAASVLGFSAGRIEQVPVSDWIECGPRRIVRIRARGWSLNAADTHPVLTSRGWCVAGDLEQGDHVAIARQMPVAGDLEVADDEVRLAGYLIADGVIDDRPSLCAQHQWKIDAFGRTLAAVFPGARVSIAHGRVALRRGTPTELDNLRVGVAIAAAGQSVGAYLGQNAPRFLRGDALLDPATVDAIEADGVRLDGFRGYLRGTEALHRWADHYGLSGRAPEKTLGAFARVPLRQAPILAEALWFCDGYVSADAREVSYTTASRSLSVEVRDLLLRLGVLSTCREKRVDDRPYFTVALVESTKKRFIELVRLNGPKGDRLRGAEIAPSNTNVDALPFDLWSQHDLAGEFRAWHHGRRGLSRERFVRCGGSPEIARQQVWWAQVQDVTPMGEQECYDLTVDTPEHAYVADGFVVHNSTLLECVLAAIDREGPTRGKLAKLATTRDAYVEVGLVNGSSWTIRQSIDAVSGKGESLVLDEAGRSVLSSAKLTEFAAWRDVHLPSREVLLSSLFAAQGSGGFLDLSPGERKAVVLRLLGIERLELLADRAREHARVTERELASVLARLDEVSFAARRIDYFEAQLEAACAGEAEWAAAVTKQEAELAAAREQAEVARHAAAEAAQIDERRAELARRRSGVETRITDVTRRLENNRAVLTAEAEIRDAVARVTELDAELAVLGEERASAKVRVEAAENAALSATRAEQEAHGREQRALDEVARLEGELAQYEREASAASDYADACAEAEAARATLDVATANLDRLERLGRGTAATRIDGLRIGLGRVVDSDGIRDARRVARNALTDDDRSDMTAFDLERQIGEAGAVVDAAERRIQAATERRQTATQATLAAQRVDGVQAELATAKAGADAAAEEAQAATTTLSAHRKARANAIRTSFELGHRIDELRTERARLEASAKRAQPLAQAEARIAELEPQLEQLTGELAAIARAISELPEPPGVAPAPDVAAAERRAEEARHRLTAMRVAIGTHERALADARAAAARVDQLETERARQNEELADWTKLALDLGKDGVQALEIDAAGPELTELANDLLLNAFGPRWTISFDTTRRSADGKKQLECFEINVVDTERGRDGGVEGLSGGERVIVGEAISLALTVLACRRSGMTGVTLVRDESGAALDPGNARAYVGMLRRAADLIGADKVLIVSHSADVQEMCDARVLVSDGRVEVQP